MIALNAATNANIAPAIAGYNAGISACMSVISQSIHEHAAMQRTVVGTASEMKVPR